MTDLKFNYFELLIGLSILLGSSLITLNYAYGAGSLSELQNQVNATSKYKEELVDYAIKHNMSVLLYKEHCNFQSF
jgi:hypothetical protein